MAKKCDNLVEAQALDVREFIDPDLTDGPKIPVVMSTPKRQLYVLLDEAMSKTIVEAFARLWGWNLQWGKKDIQEEKATPTEAVRK